MNTCNHEIKYLYTLKKKMPTVLLGQIANICGSLKKAREFQKKTSTSALFTTPKPLTV